MKVRFFAASLGVFSFLILVFASDGFALSSKPPRLDDATRGCIKCHKMDVGKHFGPAHTVHIVGIDYVEAARRSPSLVSAGSLDPRLKLVDGRVSCITCHTEYVQESHTESYMERDNPEATRYPMLRVDNSGSGLCLKCHRK